ncbi:MAG TPA: Hsp70 family protein [Polyangiaceae bacterium]|nr:Hsp70 family protein [Polyangiaceae bacterium]
MMARHAVGIDLGTTNTVMASAPLEDVSSPSIFDIRQLVAPGAVEARALFPSMLYAPLEGEQIEDAFGDAPWALGEIARRRGAEVPGRLVASSKSWLAYSAVERTAAILPWAAPEATPKISPVDAATRVLRHARLCWDAEHPGAPLAEQEVVLTVPASFDEVARELSLTASRNAGLDPKLLEEPQAAFYDWMSRSGADGIERLQRETSAEAVVLVVDVGGGTTDLSLIRVGGPDRVTRAAVGPHLLLGGDNMDLALAHALEARLVEEGGKLEASAFANLVAACRATKERLLGPDAPDELPVAIAGRGAALVGSVLRTRLTRSEVEGIVLDGFLPVVSADARPQRMRSAIVAFGLPYERDVAVTRHIAAFLGKHLAPGEWPHAVLLNGGVFRAARAADRIIEVLARWRGGPVARLPDADPDLAVARGAVVYARARACRGTRITGGTARSYFVGVAGDLRSDEERPRAVCVVPRGAEEGTVHTAAGRTFTLVVGRPVRFDLFSSDVVEATPGDVHDVDEERFVRLPPVVTTIDPRPGAQDEEVSVGIEGELTPVGTVDLACLELGVSRGADAETRRAASASVAAPNRPRRFRLAFDLRRGGPASVRPSVSSPPRRLDDALARIERAYGKARTDTTGREAKDLMRDLEQQLGERSQWTTETNRALYDALLPGAAARRRSPDHERIFWLLAGWCIRPGFGDPLDARRVAELYARFDERLSYPAEIRGWQQFWIAWRRAAGGLDETAQLKIRDAVDAYLGLSPERRRPKKAALALDEALEMASALERVPPGRRAELGGWVLERTWTERDPRLWAAIGRLGARIPTYASVHHVVTPQTAERWLDHLLREKWQSVPTAIDAAVRLARRTGDRARDVSERMRSEVERRLVAAGARHDQIVSVQDVVPVGESDRAAFFGDALPLGLKLVD